MVMGQFDIEGAFLNGPLEEVLYVKDQHATGNRAWQLKKSLYSTKQAARNWNKFIDDILRGLGFAQCPDDPGFYFRKIDGSLIVLHVDDLLCAFPDTMALAEWKEALAQHLTVEDRGMPERFLGMDMVWKEGQVQISGKPVIISLADDFMINKLAAIPYLIIEDSTELAEIKPFQILVSRLLFISRMWRPNIGYAVNQLCARASQPRVSDVRKGCRVIVYLLGTAGEGICLRGVRKMEIDIFTDAGEEKLEEKATTGILVLLGNLPISWAARKQDVMTLSSTEVEYIALGAGAQDGMWIAKVMEFLNKPVIPRVWTDNRGASTLSYNPDFHRRTKHIWRRHHFVKECVDDGDISVHWVPGENNPADMLTKPVTGKRLEELKKQAGMTA